MTNKNPFIFSYYQSSLDWYEKITVTVNWNDYDYFCLERRYGPTWWLIGYKDREPEDIGRLGECNNNARVKDFIKWSKIENKGSKILKITAISSSLDVVDGIWGLLKELKND